MSAPRSILLITVDCFRADHAGFLGYDRPTTPFLDSLAGESLVFSNAIVAGSPTYFSFPAIMASRYPLALGRDVIGLAPGESTLASGLSQNGYATAAFLAGNPYLSHRFGYDSGFETFKEFLDHKTDKKFSRPDSGRKSRTASVWNRRLTRFSHALGPVGTLYDELYFQYCQRIGSSPSPSLDELLRFPLADVIVDHAQEWLTAISGQPFFMWLHFMDPHSPYYPRQEALKLMGQAPIDGSRARYLNSYWNRGDLGTTRLRRHREDVISLYDAGIRWVDAQVARLAKVLQALGAWENCVVAVTADHGEEFLDHGGRYHPPSSVAEELIRVPLLLRAPGLIAPAVETAPFSLLHLAPTLLDLVGVPMPDSFRGRSYVPSLRSNPGWGSDAIVECIARCNNPLVSQNRLQPRLLAVRESRYKMVLNFETAEEQLFDLEADKLERRPLPNTAGKPVRKRLLDRARQHLSDSLSARDPDRRLAARLHDLRFQAPRFELSVSNSAGILPA